MENLLTGEALAEMLAVPVSTLYKWRYKRSGPTAIKVGKHLRYRAADVESWLKKQQSDPRA